MSAVPAAGVALAVVAEAGIALYPGARGAAGYSAMPASASAVRAPPPMPPQISVSTPCVLRNTASAPWPLPFVSTTSLEVILPFSTVYSLNCCVWPKCWNTSPFS